MKYAARFIKGVDLNDFDQIIINYSTQSQELPLFLQEHKDKTIILEISDVDAFCNSQQIEILNALYHKYKNFIVCLYSICKFSELTAPILDKISVLEAPFMLGMPITNFDQLRYVLDLGVSSVYLAEDICFDMWGAKRVCSENGVQIRVFANVAQGSIKSGPALKKFFLRPEDVEEYSDCIDVIEFWGPENRQSVLKTIYSKGRWPGDLSTLILGLDLSIDSRYIQPSFGRLRKNCQRKCMKGEQCKCCELIVEISQKEQALIDNL
jgi:hypothetical protein